MSINDIHPNDIRLFKSVTDAMRYVAKEYELPLGDILPFPNPEYSSSPLGDCHPGSGEIRIVLRGMNNGVWDDEPRREQDVWGTAAHELAHLRYHNHGPSFQEFELELQEAMNNRRVNYTQKVIDRLLKMQEMRDGFARMGSESEAEAFAGMINKMLIENELNPNDLDYARGLDNDPVIELFCDLSKYPLAKKYGYSLHGKKSRIAWQESLARVVAEAHLCTFVIQLGTNNIVFIGTKSHVTVAEYVYGNLVRSATAMSIDERALYQSNLRNAGRSPNEERGFRAAWTTAFIRRISERFIEARKAAVHEVSSDINTQSTALLRLNNCVIKVQKFMDDKFGQKRRYANALNSGRTNHAEGQAAGRAAADRMNIGRKGINSGSTKGHLGDGS